MTEKKPSLIEIFLWNQTLYEIYGIYPTIKQN